MRLDKRWVRAAGARAIKAFAEGMLGHIGTGALYLGDVNWVAALSAGVLASLVSLLINLKGLPELEDGT